ncbi:MAG TPA: hypothetical protein VNW46_13895 [Gemmatimonadaceae bacterium]|jgi:hypothetical protein|nr:hypothetical protein [Gemmatimonadaceae bacterium]
MSPISPLKTEPAHGATGNPAGSPTAVSVLDSHWAVTAIDAQERSRALSAAQRLWAERHGPAPATDPDVTVVSVLATAYDVAALDWLDPFVRRASGDTGGGGTSGSVGPPSDALRPPLIAVAARTFQLHRVLPLRGTGEAGLFGLLHVAALATVADRRSDLSDWLRTGNAVRELHADADADWEVVLADRLAHVWTDLLAPARGGHRRAVARLGALREERDAGEAALLEGLSEEAAVARRFRLFTLYHMADAAAALITYLTRSEPVDILRRLSLHFTVARAAAAGDASVDVALSWLHGAAVLLAQRRTEQLALPGLSQ